MVIFHSYVSLPEGKSHGIKHLSMGDLQDPTDGGTLVLYMFGHIFCGDIP